MKSKLSALFVMVAILFGLAASASAQSMNAFEYLNFLQSNNNQLIQYTSSIPEAISAGDTDKAKQLAEEAVNQFDSILNQMDSVAPPSKFYMVHLYFKQSIWWAREGFKNTISYIDSGDETFSQLGIQDFKNATSYTQLAGLELKLISLRY
jgi:hypothetical protein